MKKGDVCETICHIRSGGARHGLEAKPLKMSFSPTVKHTGQESKVNCAKLSNVDLPAVEMCKQCVQTAFWGTSSPTPIPGLRP